MFGSGIMRVVAMAAQRAVAKKAHEDPAPKLLVGPKTLKAAMPYITSANLNKYLESFNVMLIEYDITTSLRIAHLISQLGHESNDFSAGRENLNYSAKRLLQVFPKYFKAAEAKAYERKPEKIANRVYANRLGNGNEASGDGWKYRGAGPIQLTGKDNFIGYSEFSGFDVVNDPDLIVEDPDIYMDTAGYFWSGRGLSDIADTDDIVAVTKRINGGKNGLSDRRLRLSIAKKALGI